MKEPILSREEVLNIVDEVCAAEDINYYKFGEKRLLLFVERLESALLEKLCGEPVAWRYPYRGKYAFYGIGDTVSADSIEDSEPLYALNRSNA